MSTALDLASSRVEFGASLFFALFMRYRSAQ